MLCEICGKNEATFHYSEVVNGKKTEHHLCNECAANTDISYYSSLFDGDGRLGQLLSGLLGNAFVLGDAKEDPKQHIICPGCGMSYGEFIKNSIFGCNECYDVFGPLLDDSIKKIQGSVNHTGKKPKNSICFSEDTKEQLTESIDKAYKDSKILTEGEVSDIQTETANKSGVKQEVDRLSKRLKVAVLEEDFEEAAKLRDKIKELKEML